ncbi:MAG: xylulokinase, partial [Clostridia bacterium]|nr:xylulokinase [Clostridia bacterium]
MKYYIGLDVGTSGMKAMLINEDGIVRVVSREYPLSFPNPGWSEQNPDDWFEAGISAIGELVSDIDKSAVRAISFSGQMHGLVMLGSGDS